MNNPAVLLVVALDEEYKTLKTVLPVTRDHSTKTRIIHAHGSANGFDIFSVLSHEMGAHEAYDATIEGIEMVKPCLVVSLGIAGALDNDLSLLDVCVATEILDLQQVNKIEGKDGSDVVKFLPKVYNTDPELSSTCQFLISHNDLSSSYAAWQEANKLPGEGAQPNSVPKMFRGPVCCGDVIASESRKELIRSLNRKVLCVETESGGVVRATSKNNLPFLVVKGICDTADENKSELERDSKGLYRQASMKSATQLVLEQMKNPWFATAVRNSTRYTTIIPDEITETQSILRNVTEYTIEKLRNISPEFQKRHDTAYLPLPRVYAIEGSTPNLRGDQRPQISVRGCINDHRKSLIRIPRGYSSNTLGYSLALSLIRSPVASQPTLPIVIDVSKISPANISLDKLVPFDFIVEDASRVFDVILICQNLPLNSVTRMKALSTLLSSTNYRMIFLSVNEDYVVEREEFVKKNDVVEYDLAPIPFSETALFIETTFGFDAAEADAIALKVDQTFRRFNLLADPTYYAGIDPESLDALLNANQRAELIQLAVSGILSLLVARDSSLPRLTRSTRERFLRILAIGTRVNNESCDQENTLQQANDFLKENGFDLTATEFLKPYYETGVLYDDAGEVKFGHPYLEAYLLASKLKENLSLSLSYFDPEGVDFDSHTYDLYCELGPAPEVLDQIIQSTRKAISASTMHAGNQHPLLDKDLSANLGGSVLQIAAMYGSAEETNQYDKPENTNKKIREEKQKTIDIQREVGKRVAQREYKRTDSLPIEVQKEFEVLDGLSRHLSLCILAVNAGAETIALETKKELVELALHSAWSFSNIWIRNRLRTNFDAIKEEMKQEKDSDHVYHDGEKLTRDLQVALFMERIEHVSEPLDNVLSRLCATASNVVLPIVKNAKDLDSVGQILRAAWVHELSPSEGKRAIRDALQSYHGSAVLRLKLADHLLARLYWRHCGAGSADHFLASVQRALAPIKLKLTDETLERARESKN